MAGPADMTIRRAAPADADAVRDLTRAAYAIWVPVAGREPLPMRADHAAAIRDHVVDLVEDGGALVALIELVPEPDCLLIENVAVRPEAQGRGLGETLLGHAEAVARDLGRRELRLYTNALFTANIAFYAKRGYREVGRETLAPGAVAVHMRKALQEQHTDD